MQGEEVGRVPGATYLSRDPTLGYITVLRRACSHGVLGPPPGFLILQVWEKPKNLHGWPFLLTPVWLWDTLTLLPRLSPGLRSSPMSGARVSLLDGRLPQATWAEEAWGGCVVSCPRGVPPVPLQLCGP